MDAIRTRKLLGSVIYDGAKEIGRVKYLIVDKVFIENYPHYDFFVDDMAHIITEGLVDRIIYIMEIFVAKEYRESYYGSELLHELAKAHTNDVLVLRAGALKCEYPEEPSDDELNSIIRSLIPFFNKCGFVSINAYCGFESSEAMMYIGNDVGRNAFYDLLIGGYLSKPRYMKNKKYVWKDIVEIDGKTYAEEFRISGTMDGTDHYQIDEFIEAVAKKHGVDADDIKTYIMDDIDFDARSLPFGAEDCGCYINGIPSWEWEEWEDSTQARM